MKKLIPHIISFLGLGVVYFILLIIFWHNLNGFIFYFILFILVELIYYFLKKKTNIIANTKRKIIVITLITILLIIISAFLFALVDFSRIKNDKNPLFSIRKISWSTGANDLTAAVYSGLGYKIVSCKPCINKHYITFFTNIYYPFEYVNCSNDVSRYQYTFTEGIVTDVYQKNIVENVNEEDIDYINNLDNCGAEFDYIDNQYTLEKWCTLDNMTEEEIEKVFGSEVYRIKMSRKDVVDDLKKEKSTKCELSP